MEQAYLEAVDGMFEAIKARAELFESIEPARGGEPMTPQRKKLLHEICDAQVTLQKRTRELLAAIDESVD